MWEARPLGEQVCLPVCGTVLQYLLLQTAKLSTTIYKHGLLSLVIIEHFLSYYFTRPGMAIPYCSSTHLLNLDVETTTLTTGT